MLIDGREVRCWLVVRKCEAYLTHNLSLMKFNWLLSSLFFYGAFVCLFLLLKTDCKRINGRSCALGELFCRRRPRCWWILALITLNFQRITTELHYCRCNSHSSSLVVEWFGPSFYIRARDRSWCTLPIKKAFVVPEKVYAWIMQQGRTRNHRACIPKHQ